MQDRPAAVRYSCTAAGETEQTSCTLQSTVCTNRFNTSRSPAANRSMRMAINYWSPAWQRWEGHRITYTQRAQLQQLCVANGMQSTQVDPKHNTCSAEQQHQQQCQLTQVSVEVEALSHAARRDGGGSSCESPLEEPVAPPAC
jgi:hypothetical protein